jgi:hypothetical protein
MCFCCIYPFHSVVNMSQRVGTNMMLAATLACLSYVPFEYVAKGSLILAVLIFIIDPIPPLSRILSILLVVFVRIISQLHHRYIQDEIDHSENGITIITNTTTGNATHQHHDTSIVTDQPPRTDPVSTGTIDSTTKKDN